VLIGGAMSVSVAPLIRNALMESSEVATRSATALFLAACVYTALMVIVARTAGTIVSGWRIPFLQAEPAAATAWQAPAATIPPPLAAGSASASPMGERVRSMLAALPPTGDTTIAAGTASSHVRTTVMGLTPATTPLVAPRTDKRLQGVGSRFRARPDTPSKARLS
jgi:type IV secretion system protein VirB6